MSLITRWKQWRTVRNARRTGREALFHASHARGMREDIAPPEALAELDSAEVRMKSAIRSSNPTEIASALDGLATAARIVYPPKPHAQWRERMETLVIAGAIAMGVRTYFIQPFKIPTGSMQPTLNGVTIGQQSERRWYDIPPISFVGWALWGEGFVTVRARTAGYLSPQPQNTEDGYVVFVNQVAHPIRRDMPLRVQPGAWVMRGDVLASGRVRMGDHIFVNKIRYNFLRPARGNVFVFDTSRVDHPDIRGDSFYIKRLVGLPGETIRIDPPYLKVNGKRVTSPEPFRRLVEDRAAGYHGYIPASGISRSGAIPPLASPEDSVTLGPRAYLPMGDNTLSSLDGRYFGPVPADSIVGPAFWVYWPFTRRWGPIR
ncbi:MAG: signal peptidase I [Kiritimatiellia bacterium]|nr:signal peptidase I [Kiritimatiellia bacterium]